MDPLQFGRQSRACLKAPHYPCYIPFSRDPGPPPSPHHADVADGAQPPELRRPQCVVCGPAAGAGGVPHQQGSDRLAYQRLSDLLHDRGTLRRPLGGPLFAEVDYRLRRHFLERAHPAYCGHPHLHAIAHSAHPRRNRGSDLRHYCADFCGRPVFGTGARTHSGSVLPGHSGRFSRRLSARRPSRSSVRLALPVLHRGCSRIPAGARSALCRGTRARPV